MPVRKDHSNIGGRAILDLGSQRSYITAKVQEALNLRKVRSESMIIKTFRSDNGDHRACDIMELKMSTKNGGSLTISTVVVLHICDPADYTLQLECIQHLSNLEVADSGHCNELQIDILIGSTGRVVKGSKEPTVLLLRRN